MLLPTLHQLQYLKLLSKHSSFNHAAKNAHVTQPTLSTGIQKLEKILDAPVIDQTRSNIILTAAEQKTVQHTENILAQTKNLVQAAHSASQPLTNQFKLNMIPTIAPYLLPHTLPILHNRFPKLKLFLHKNLTHRLINALKTSTLNTTLITLPYNMNNLD